MRPVLLNASAPMLATPLGMVMSRREAHPENEAGPMASSALSAGKLTALRDEQPRKADLLIAYGRTKLFRSNIYVKTISNTLMKHRTFVDEEILTFHKFTLSENASSPMVVTVDPIMTVLMFGQPLKAPDSIEVEPNVFGTAYISTALWQETDKQSEQDILASCGVSLCALCCLWRTRSLSLSPSL